MIEIHTGRRIQIQCQHTDDRWKKKWVAVDDMIAKIKEFDGDPYMADELIKQLTFTIPKNNPIIKTEHGGCVKRRTTRTNEKTEEKNGKD